MCHTVTITTTTTTSVTHSTVRNQFLHNIITQLQQRSGVKQTLSDLFLNVFSSQSLIHCSSISLSLSPSLSSFLLSSFFSLILFSYYSTTSPSLETVTSEFPFSPICSQFFPPTSFRFCFTPRFSELISFCLFLLISRFYLNCSLYVD